MNVFLQNDYRKTLRLLVKERKQFDRRFGFHALAEAARIQRPYLSKVMKGTANLSNDQMYLISQALKLTQDEQDHLQLLLDFERAAVADRKNQLNEKIRFVNERYRDSTAHLAAKELDTKDNSRGIMDYYLDPLIQIIHIAISIDYFSKNPSALAAELHIPGPQLHSILTRLEQMGLIYRKGQKILTSESNIHLSKTSPLYRAWRNQIKLSSAQRLNQLSEKDAYSFSTIFSAHPGTQKEIHERFLAFLKSCEDLVKNAPAKQVYQLSFDLFPWTSLRS